MRHVVVMTATGSVGLMSLFVVDFADMYFLSLLGEKEVAGAAGYAGSIIMLNISVCIGLTIAISALVSRAVGAGHGEDARQYAASTVLFTILITSALAVVLWLGAGPFLAMLGATGETHAIALSFSRIVVPSLPLLGLGMCCAGILRAIGDPKRSMYTTLSGGIVNAVLDPIFIFALANAQGGNAVRNLSQQFGIDESQARSAIEQLAPMVAAGFRRNAQGGQGMSDLIGALQGGGHERYVDDTPGGGLDDMAADGNGILGHIFGSKDVSRAVAANAADTTGLSSGILKQLLPIIASMVMGSMSKRTREPGLQDIIGDVLGGALGGGNSSGSGAGGGMLGDILGSVLGGGEPDAGSQQTQQRREPSLQDVFGDLLDDGSGGTAADRPAQLGVAPHRPLGAHQSIYAIDLH